MSKIAFSLVLSGFLGITVLGGVYFAHVRKETSREHRQISDEIALVQEELQSAREELKSLASAIRNQRSALDLAARAPRGDAGDAGAAPVAAVLAEPAPEAIQQVVVAALAEERKQREDERTAQREEMRKRMEERRAEEEALAQGPYDRYNVKVNSMAKLLGLTDAQKQAYYEALKAGADGLSEARKLAVEKAAADRAAAGEGEDSKQGRGMGRGDRGAMRELFTASQKEFATALEQILTPDQLETYNQLPEQSKSFQNLGAASATDGGNGFRVFGGGGAVGGRTQRGGGAAALGGNARGRGQGGGR